METHKNANLLVDTNNESLKLAKENGMVSMIRIIQFMVKEMKIVRPLNLKLKPLNQVFAIVQTHIFL